jgi:hypothetical protein
MIKFVRSYLIYVFIVSAFLYVLIFLFKIIPTIKTNRKIHWSDWLGKNYNHFSYLSEYKAVCIKNERSLFWHNLCWTIFFFLAVSILVCFIIFIIQ